LLTRGVFNSGRQFIKVIPRVPVEEQAELNWQAHGAYLIKGLAEPVEIFEVGERGLAPFLPPPSGGNAQRSVSAEEEATLGWRPAKGLEVPRRVGWRLEAGLGEGGFGEVWLAENLHTSERRVFKFCFDVGRLRSFKRELLLFRLIRERLGPRRDIALLYEVQLEAPPFFLESEYCPGGTLKQWFEAKCANGDLPIGLRLEIVARVARALAAAHSVGIIHKDLKPANIFIEERDGTVWPKLADFGIGVLIDRTAAEGMTGVTAAGEPSPTGSYLYTPPEYLVNQPASIQGDVYSLGVVLYQMVVGDFARPLGLGWHRDIPDALLAEDIATCVDWDPQRRFSSALQIAEKLETLDQRRAERATVEATERRLAEQQCELAAHRRKVRLGLTVGAAALVLMAALVALAVVLNHSRKDAVEHGKQLQAQRERAEDMFYIADMQTATEDMAQRRGEMTREIIERHRPQPGERDRRGWEWFFVDSVLNTPVWVRNVSELPLRALAVSADEKHIALAGYDCAVSIWQRDTLEKIRTFTPGGAVRALSWHRSGALAVALSNGEIALIASPLAGGEMRRWQAHQDGVTSVEWRPQGDQLASGGADGTVARWNESGKSLRRVERTAPILGLSWHPEGAEMAVLFGRPAQLVVATPESIATERATELKIEESPLAWRPDGQEIAIAMQDWPMRSWNPQTNGDSFSVPDLFSAGSTAFAWSPRGEGVAIGGVDGKILLVDGPRAAESRMALYGHRGRVNALRWIGTDEERLLSTGDDGTLRVWSDLRQSPQIRSLNFNGDLADAQWHPKENRLAVLVAGDEVQILRGDTGGMIAAWPLPPPCKPRASYRGGRVLWSPDGKRLAAICAGRPLAIWSEVGEAIRVIATSGEESDAQWMPDSARLLVRREDGWSLLALEGDERHPIEGSASAVWVGGLGGDALALVLNGEGGARVRRQNPGDTATLEVAVPPELRKVRCCVLNADRALLAVGGETGGVAWMDTRTGEWQRPAIQHAGPVRNLAWNPDGSRLVTAGADATCRLFATAQCAQTWLLAHQLQSDTVATGWSADGRRLMIASGPRRALRINDASRSIDLQQSAEPKSMTTAERVSEACARIAAQPDDEAGWRALEKGVRMGANDNPDAAFILAAATLGAQAQFRAQTTSAPPNAKLATQFEEVALPAAVQVAQACVLRDWPTVLKLCAEAQRGAAAASWFALAKAEALLQLDRRAEAEQANLAAWTARREQSGVIETPMPPITGFVDNAPRHVDLRAWANIQLSEDWSGGVKNSLSSLPALVPQPDGYNFRCGEFLQLAGKISRTSSGCMLPRETGWIPFGCEARRVVLMIAACFIDPGEDYADLCIGSVFLQRSDGRGAVRIPLVYGENIWDWWVPAGGNVSDAPPEAIAWRGETPLSREQGQTAALFRLVWQAEADAPPVVAASLVSNLRRPTPFLLAITVGSAPPTTGAASPTFP